MSFGARRQLPVLKSPDSPSRIPLPTQFLVVSFSTGDFAGRPSLFWVGILQENKGYTLI